MARVSKYLERLYSILFACVFSSTFAQEPLNERFAREFAPFSKAAAEAAKEMEGTDLFLIAKEMDSAVPGRRGQVDDKRAARLYEAACAFMEAFACNNLGLMYEQGRGVIQEYARAADYYNQSCKGKDHRGCYNVGLMLLDGRGIEQDLLQAATNFRLACDGGLTSGCNELGVMLQNGIGLPQDERLAVALFRAACDDGLADGCGNLGFLVCQGRGVEQNQHEGTLLMRRACDSGEPNTQIHCERLSEKGLQ